MRNLVLAVLTLGVVDGWSDVAAHPSTIADAGNVAWVYPVPPPEPEPMRPLGRTESMVESSLRKQIAQLRRDSNAVVDGYQRQVENCRYESTLHFEDTHRTRLIGNDEFCRNRYLRMIRTERQFLKQRIRETRGANGDRNLRPQSAP